MLSAAAYSFKLKSRLAISLSWVAGYTNVTCLLYCGLMTSHVTGNVTHVGQELAHVGELMDPKHFWPALLFLSVVLCFFVGAVLSGAMTELARLKGARSKYILPMAVEAVLLAVVTVLINVEMGSRTAENTKALVMAGLASVAMGLQNATITQISGSVVRTTHLTGVITDLGLEGVQLWLWLQTRLRGYQRGRYVRMLRVSRRQTSVIRLLLLLSIFGSFVFGVVAGSLVYFRMTSVGLMPAVLFLLWIIVVDYVTPIADVSELDPLSDPELRGLGIDRALLPRELGIYRVAHRRTDRHHLAPSFQGWIERLPEHARVVILAITPQLRFDSNAMLDLQNGVSLLRRQGRRLVLAGVTPVHYRALDRLGVTNVLEVEDLCPDLEFALARGLELVRRSRPQLTAS